MNKPISKESADWRPLKSWLVARIHEAQLRLERRDPLIDERTHDMDRGVIAAHRALLNTVEPAPRLEAESLEAPILDERSGY